MFENLSLNAACAEQHEAVIEKGFTPQPVATNLMLIVSELGEACEADRKNRHAIKNSVAYLQSWRNTIAKDNKLIVTAAAKAERAAKYILNIN